MADQPITAQIIERATREANERFPQPHQAPLSTALMTAILIAVILSVLKIADEFLSRDWAEVVVIILCSLVAFLDCRQKWEMHSRALRDAIERLRCSG
jgi:UDP-N-acetylmuramyl pentapeptide phosphotransferase/UDP-N-acetylglucosamine-1-phosphate transferase